MRVENKWHWGNSICEEDFHRTSLTLEIPSNNVELWICCGVRTALPLCAALQRHVKRQYAETLNGESSTKPRSRSWRKGFAFTPFGSARYELEYECTPSCVNEAFRIDANAPGAAIWIISNLVIFVDIVAGRILGPVDPIKAVSDVSVWLWARFLFMSPRINRRQCTTSLQVCRQGRGSASATPTARNEKLISIGCMHVLWMKRKWANRKQI